MTLLTDAQASILGLLSQTTSWLPDHSYEQADMALQMSAKAWAPFAGIDGARIETGRHGNKISTDSTRLLAGLAWQKPLESSRFLAALFVEGNFGRFHTEGYFNTQYYDRLKAKGDIEAIDAGLVLRHTWDGGFRVEASGRVGWAHYDYKSPSFNQQHFDWIKYDMDIPYVAAHAGLGFEHPLSDVSSLDFSARYFLTRMGGEDVTLSNGERITFDDSVSSRARGGVRYSRQHNPRMRWYFGGYWEQEFGGKTKGYAHGQSFESDQLKGGTGVGEVGIIFKSTPDRPWNVEAGLQGYGGANRGFSGGVRFGYEF
jgi:hypothetical protein